MSREKKIPSLRGEISWLERITRIYYANKIVAIKRPNPVIIKP
jgi:hypothetical protein